MSIVKEYFKLSNEYQEQYGDKTILFMMIGKFYEVYAIYEKHLKLTSVYSTTQNESQMIEFTNACNFSLGKKTTQEIECGMAGFPELYIDKYVQKMQEHGYTVVVYNQEDTGNKVMCRKLAGIFSSGTLFSNDLNSLNNNTTCVWIDFIKNNGINSLSKGNYIVTGIANINIYTGKTTISQTHESFLDNPTTYDNLERFISVHNPSEVIIISNMDEKYIRNMIQYTNIDCKKHIISLNPIYDKTNINSERAKNCQNIILQESILKQTFDFNDFNIFTQNFYGNHIAQNAFCFLIDFVQQHNPQLLKHIDEPIFENYNENLILANHSLKQLHIINHDEKGKFSSISQFLNQCFTPMGKRKFNDILLSPITNPIILQNEYNIVEHFMSNIDSFRPFLQNLFPQMKDIDKFIRKLFISKTTPKNFVQLHSDIISIKNVFSFFQNDSVLKDYLSNLTVKIDFDNFLNLCDDIINFVTSHIILEIADNIDNTTQFDINFFVSGVNAELDEKNKNLKNYTSSLQSIKEYFNSLLEIKEKKKADYIKYHITDKCNYNIICTSRRSKILNECFPKTNTTIQLTTADDGDDKIDFIVSQSQFEFKKQSATNVYISDGQISNICKNIQSINFSLRDLLSDVYTDFIKRFQSFKGHLEQISHFVTLIDVIQSKAHSAVKYNYCKPVIDISADKSFLNASNLRHCLIEQLQQDELYVANNVSLGTDNSDGILLYGTNAVGKTSLIRSIGIAVIMAQAGMFVPCSNFIYKPYNYIFTRILGNDNIFKGLSTFAVEMSELRTILRLGNENSLILGDELCSGTEIISAVSIFVAGIQKLSDLKSSFIFATHLHEIVDYDEITQLSNLIIKHMEVVYDKQNDLLVYDRLLKDGPGNSLYGLEVCKSLSLSDDFINSAYVIRNKYHNNNKIKLNPSHFNAKKNVNMCENCNIKPADEVHHLQHQNESNERGHITSTNTIFHKNNKANLYALCEECHNAFHDSGKQHKKVKTSKGHILVDVKINH